MTNTDNTQSNLVGNSANFTFGNFQTQICGAMSMGLIQSQSELAKTGAKLAKEFTNEQKESYAGQSTFLTNAYNASISSAHSQALAMRLQAGGEFASAGIGFASLGFQKWASSDTSKQLDAVNDKLAQQEKLLDLAHKTTPKPVSLTVTGQPVPKAAPTTYTDEVVQDRQAQLLAEGGSTPKVLGDTTNQKYMTWHAKDDTTTTEQDQFKQADYNRNKSNYYNDKATDEEVNKKTAVKGAYYIKNLDEKAISGMDVNEHAKFIEKLHAEIKSTRVEINTATQHLSELSQKRQAIAQSWQQCATGAFQIGQSFPTASSKEHEAAATLDNNAGGIAAGIAQNANQAKEGALSMTQNAMQSFGRVYDGMRA